MNIENSIIIIHLFDPMGKSSFPLKDAIIVKDIESLTIQDSSIHLSSTVNIVVPFALGFLFHNEVAYKYIKIIQQEKPMGTQTALREECIWWGKVNSIGMQSNIKNNTINIVGKSFADTYNYVTVDHQIYKNAPIKKIFESNSQIICNDATHGSRASVMSMSDIVFVPKGKDHNHVIPSFTRSLGETAASVLKKILAKGVLYFFSTMYKGQPKIIVNSLPIVPDGEYGFDPEASYLTPDKTLTYTCVLNEPARCNADNLISLSFTGDYTGYRDRIRIFIDENEAVPTFNPLLDGGGRDDRSKPMYLAPWVPLVIDRQNLSRSEANVISDTMWNNKNLQSPSFYFEIAGWELFGAVVEVGRIIKFTFKVLAPYIDPTTQDQDKKVFDPFPLNEEEMIITQCTKRYSKRGFTAQITLVRKDSFLTEKVPAKANTKSSYFTGYEGAANDNI